MLSALDFLPVERALENFVMLKCLASQVITVSSFLGFQKDREKGKRFLHALFPQNNIPAFYAYSRESMAEQSFSFFPEVAQYI